MWIRLLQHAATTNSAAGADAVAEHGITAPCRASPFHTKTPKQHEAHVADARVGDQALEIGLGEGQDAP